MKKSLIFCFLVAVNTAHAEIEMVPLDMELGYWETSAEIRQSDAISKMLENIPEAQQAMMREMMASSMKIPTTKQCITSDFFKDLKKKMRESMGRQGTGQDCNFVVTNSSSKEFSGKLSCQGMETLIHTKVINSKRQESIVENMVAGMGGTKIKMVAEWKAKTCPEGL